ncbi:MAG TPA: SUMF1/EgtB/PvdO family nonheme iron enzyme, partial [Bradyrhizobium sp.]|uniref:formylglycine-generating enzyme family protein n=1 Tax=Bradyrhizobium sp. TaxID=376 RepID=UPI002D7EFFC8
MLIVMKVKTAMIVGALVAPVLATTFAPVPRDNHDGPDGALRLSSAVFSYRAAGDFSQNGKPVAGPLRQLRLPSDLLIMDHLVTAGEYAQCVADGGCPRVAAASSAPDVPMVGVNWHDASAYAAWISQKTGVTHRLPTDEEWTLAAAEKASDEAAPLVDPADPAQAWIARYEAEAAR